MLSSRLCESEDIAAVIRLFETIASEEAWQPGNGLQAWCSHSVYFGVRSAPAGGEIIGGLQLVLPNPITGALPGDSVWPELAANSGSRQDTAHIAVMAVDREWRGRFGDMFWRLEVLLWRHCVLAGIRELTLDTTPRTLACYRRFGWPMKITGELREHWGEPCYPCSVDVCSVGGSIAGKAVRSSTYWGVFEAAARPTEEALVR